MYQLQIKAIGKFYQLDVTISKNANTAERYMTKHTIEIEGLPEGWEAVAYRVAVPNIEYTVTDDMKPMLCQMEINYPTLIVQKTKPRRVVLEETDADNIRYTSGFYANQVITAGIYVANQPKIWRIKEES